jgi:hypothetical protein
MVFPMRQIMGTHAAEGISVLYDRDLILLFTGIERQSLVFHPSRECSKKYSKLETKRRRKRTDNPRFKLSRKLDSVPHIETPKVQHPVDSPSFENCTTPSILSKQWFILRHALRLEKEKRKKRKRGEACLLVNDYASALNESRRVCSF